MGQQNGDGHSRDVRGRSAKAKGIPWVFGHVYFGPNFQGIF